MHPRNQKRSFTPNQKPKLAPRVYSVRIRVNDSRPLRARIDQTRAQAKHRADCSAHAVPPALSYAKTHTYKSRPKHSEHLSWRTRTTWFKHQSAACYPMLPELCHAACAAQALVYAALKKGEGNLKKTITSAVYLPYDGRFSRRRALF